MIDTKSIPELIARLEAEHSATYSYVHLVLAQKSLDLTILKAVVGHYQGVDKYRLFASRIVAFASLEEASVILQELPKVARSIPNWSVRSADPAFWELFLSHKIGYKLHPPLVAETDPTFARLNWKALRAKKFINLVGNQSSEFVFGDSIYSYSESGYLCLLHAGRMSEYPPAFAARMCRLETEKIQEMERAYRLYIREQTDEYKEQLTVALEGVTLQRRDREWPDWLMSLLIEEEVV